MNLILSIHKEKSDMEIYYFEDKNLYQICVTESSDGDRRNDESCIFLSKEEIINILGFIK